MFVILVTERLDAETKRLNLQSSWPCHKLTRKTGKTKINLKAVEASVALSMKRWFAAVTKHVHVKEVSKATQKQVQPLDKEWRRK